MIAKGGSDDASSFRALNVNYRAALVEYSNDMLAIVEAHVDWLLENLLN